MPKYLEWDIDNPKHRQRRRRPEPVLEGEILGPETESYQDKPRIRVEVTHRLQPRQRSTLPPWLVALLIIAVLMWVSPFGAIVAIVMGAVLITSHPTFAFVVGGMIALVIGIGVHQRWRGHPF